MTKTGADEVQRRTRLDVIVSDRETIEAGVDVRKRYVVISVRDPGSRKPRVRRQEGLLDVLFLAFDDAEPSRHFELPPSIRLMTPKDAKEIWDFLELHRERAEAVVVHCEQGMSRSPAIAAAVAEKFGLDPTAFWREHQPNRFVHEMLRRFE